MSLIKRNYNVFEKNESNYNIFLLYRVQEFSYFIDIFVKDTTYFFKDNTGLFFNNFYQPQKKINAFLCNNKFTSTKLQIYYVFFNLIFFRKKVKFIFFRNFFYFFVFNNTFFYKKKNFYINHNFFIAKFFFNFFTNFNLFFNKLFFEINLYKFKRTDYLKKNTYFLNNFFLGTTQNFYKTLEYSKVYAEASLPDFNQVIFDPDVDDISFELFEKLSPNKKCYIDFFRNDSSDDEIDIFKISNERIFNLRSTKPVVNIVTEYSYPRNCTFLSFCPLFNNLLKLLVLDSIDSFLSKKIEFFNDASFKNIFIFNNINIFLYYVLNEAYLLNDIYDIDSAGLPINSSSNYFTKLTANYNYYNSHFIYNYNISAYWDNSFFGISNYSSFNYLFILNDFFFKKTMYNFSNLKKNKKIVVKNNFKYFNFYLFKTNYLKYCSIEYTTMLFNKLCIIVTKFLSETFIFKFIKYSGYFLNFFFFNKVFEIFDLVAKISNLRKVRIYFNNRRPKLPIVNCSSREFVLPRGRKFINLNSNLYLSQHSVNFFKKAKFYINVSKFMYYDNLNFSFYFLNFFKQFKYNIIYLLFTNKCSHKIALNFFKINTSFNFFYFINLAPNAVTSSLGKSLCKYVGSSISRDIYTNYTPIFFFSDVVKTKLLSFFKSSQISQFTFFYQYFLIQTLEFILNCKIFVKVFSLLKLVVFLKKNQFIQFIKSKYKYFNSKVGKGFFLVEVIEVF